MMITVTAGMVISTMPKAEGIQEPNHKATATTTDITMTDMTAMTDMIAVTDGQRRH